MTIPTTLIDTIENTFKNYGKAHRYNIIHLCIQFAKSQCYLCETSMIHYYDTILICDVCDLTMCMKCWQECETCHRSLCKNHMLQSSVTYFDDSIERYYTDILSICDECDRRINKNKDAQVELYESRFFSIRQSKHTANN